MRKLLSLIIVLVLSAPLFSQDDKTKVAFAAYWEVGDTYDFKVSKLQQQWKDDKKVRDENQEYFATFTVLEETESYYTISWSYKNNLDRLFAVPDGTMDEFSDYSMVEIIYRTSEVGDFLEVLNWEEIGKNMRLFFDQIIEVAGKENEDFKSKLHKTTEPFKEIWSSKEGIESIIMKEIQYFHFLMGVEFDITKPIVYKDELPNMFGGKPIKANAKLTFEEVDFENDFCVVKHEMDIDPKGAKEIVQQVLSNLNMESKEIKKALKKSVFEVKDRNTFEYYFYPCIPHRIETERESKFDINGEKIKRIDKIIIELIYEDEK